MVFPVVLYRCGSWTKKKAEYLRTGAFKLWCYRRLLRVPWTARRSKQSILKEIKTVNIKGNQPWVGWCWIGRTDAEAEAPVLWPPDVKSRFIRKDPDAGKDWGKKKKRVTEDKMVGWHHQLNGYEFVQTRGDGGEQGSLACCSPWGRKELDTTEQLNNKNSSS